MFSKSYSQVTTSLLFIFYTDVFIEGLPGLPIKNGFKIKLKPLFVKDENHPKSFGSLFAKISQEYTPEAILRKNIFSKLIPPPPPELGVGYSNQLARLTLPHRHECQDGNETESWGAAKYFNLPIITQPFENYKILVATAPPDIKIGGVDDSKSVVIYIVFDDDNYRSDGKPETITIPDIYFVSKKNADFDTVMPTENPDPNPIFIVNHSRPVTGLTSKQVEKFLKFRNNLIDRYKYDVVP